MRYSRYCYNHKILDLGIDWCYQVKLQQFFMRYYKHCIINYINPIVIMNYVSVIIFAPRLCNRCQYFAGTKILLPNRQHRICKMMYSSVYTDYSALSAFILGSAWDDLLISILPFTDGGELRFIIFIK